MKKLMLILSLFLTSTTHATIKIAVIDTGFDFSSKWENKAAIKATGITKPKLCANGHYDFVNDNANSDKNNDNHGHGTHIAGIIAKGNNNLDYCLVILKYYDPKVINTDNLKNSISAYKRAIRMNVDIINYSGGGVEKSTEECSLMKQALDKGIKVVAAAGNERSDLDKHPYYPALCDSRIVVVASVDISNTRLPSSNWSSSKYQLWSAIGQNVMSLLPYNSYGYMTGTSQATAAITNMIVKQLVKEYKLYRLQPSKCSNSFVENLAYEMQYKVVRSCKWES